eukprot:IDg15780t1
MTTKLTCQSLTKVILELNPAKFFELARLQLKIAIVTLVLAIHYCLLLCTRPHVRFAKKLRTLLLILLFSAISALGTWYLVLGGKRRVVGPSHIEVEKSILHRQIEECRKSHFPAPPKRTDANLDILRTSGPPGCDIVAAIAGVLLL